jgi:hypothetical protein
MRISSAACSHEERGSNRSWYSEPSCTRGGSVRCADRLPAVCWSVRNGLSLGRGDSGTTGMGVTCWPCALSSSSTRSSANLQRSTCTLHHNTHDCVAPTNLKTTLGEMKAPPSLLALSLTSAPSIHRYIENRAYRGSILQVVRPSPEHHPAAHQPLPLHRPQRAARARRCPVHPTRTYPWGFLGVAAAERGLLGVAQAASSL